MNKREFYARHMLIPDSGNLVNSWGAVQQQTGKYLLQAWNDEKTYIKREDRTDDAIMVVKLLSPKDLAETSSGGPARGRSIAAIRAGAQAYVAISTGTYPNWIDSANLDQVYPVLSIHDNHGDVFARVGPPIRTDEAFGI